jgi:hypothetical protein
MRHHIRTQDTAERIGRAFELVPPRIRERIGAVDFYEGDAAFAGLTTAHGTFSKADRGELRTWRYSDSAYYSGRHRARPRPKDGPMIVLPQIRCRDRRDYPDVYVILHELGHALMYSLVGGARGRDRRTTRCFFDGGLGKVVVKTDFCGIFPSQRGFTSYAPDEHREQFAEAFAHWLHPTAHGARTLRPISRRFYDGPGVLLDYGRRYRCDNRALLAFFNELAGYEGDRKPVMLRGL